MPALPCRPTRRERTVAGLLLLTVLLLHLWAIHYRLDPLDEGYFVYTSSRVFAGEIPYHDFSTPYTPGFFYLNAFVFKLFGLEIVNLRLAMLVPRLGTLALTFLLGRRIMPAPFALLPGLVLLADDPAPGVWESHPAYWAIFLALLSAWCICRYRERSRFSWWPAACLATGASFAFKQNIGLFSAAGLVALALAEDAALPGLSGPTWLQRVGVPLPPRLAEFVRRAIGPAALAGLCVGAIWGMRSRPEPGVLLVLATPFAALAIERLRRSDCDRIGLPGAPDPRAAATRARLAVVLGGFALVNLPWIAALTLAISAAQTPFGAFVGAIDSSGYYFPLEPPRWGAIPLLGLVILLPAALWTMFRPWPWLLRLGIAVGVVVLGVGLAGELFARMAEVYPRPIKAGVLLSVDAAQNLILYLPTLGFWVGLGLLLAGRVAGPSRFYLRWYLLAGSLLLLNQYPRLDEVHLPHSAPLLYVVGAYVLWRLHAAASRGLGRAQRGALALALFGLPLVAVWPMVEARREDLLVRVPGGPLRFATAEYEWLDLAGVNVYEQVFYGEKWRRLHDYFREHSEPGERIFVYPAAPLLYYLVDRPNASRFAHVLPGLMTPDDERDTVRRLETMPVRFVIWDTFGAELWENPSAYPTLEDYIWENYDPVASIGAFEVLRKRGT